MRIELQTKSGLNLSGVLTAGGNVIELQVYEPTAEFVQALQEHGINFSLHQKLSYQKDYVFVCIHKDKVESFLIEDEKES